MEATPEKVWEYILKLGEEIKELKERMEEMDRKLRERFKETDERLKERFKETDERLEKKFKETDERLEKSFKETDKKIKELANLFTTQWGKLVEALLSPGTLELFKEWGIKVEVKTRNVEVENEKGRVVVEYDILLLNKEEVVVIEVKTTVRVSDVKEFIEEKLSKFKEYLPSYADKRVYGAIAGLNFEEDSDKFAYRQGLFVLKASDGIVEIANDKNFKPKIW